MPGDAVNALEPNYALKPGVFCHLCGIMSTPQWRRGPDGRQSLCNACGLKFLKVLQDEKANEAEPEPVKLQINSILN